MGERHGEAAVGAPARGLDVIQLRVHSAGRAEQPDHPVDQVAASPARRSASARCGRPGDTTGGTRCHPASLVLVARRRTVARSLRSHHTLVAVAAALLTAVAACSAPSPPAVDPRPHRRPRPRPAPSRSTPSRNPSIAARSRSSGTPRAGPSSSARSTTAPSTAAAPTTRRCGCSSRGSPVRASGIGIGGGRLLVADGMYGDIRVYDLQTRQRVGEFATGSGGFLMACTSRRRATSG